MNLPSLSELDWFLMSVLILILLKRLKSSTTLISSHHQNKSNRVNKKSVHSRSQEAKDAFDPNNDPNWVMVQIDDPRSEETSEYSLGGLSFGPSSSSYLEEMAAVLEKANIPYAIDVNRAGPFGLVKAIFVPKAQAQKAVLVLKTYFAKVNPS